MDTGTDRTTPGGGERTGRTGLSPDLPGAEPGFAEALLATARSIILVLDPVGRIVRFNPFTEELCGYRLDEVIGQDWFSTFLPENDPDGLRERFDQAMRGAPTQGNLCAILTKDGQSRQIEWHARALEDASGNVTGLLAVGQDVTERMLAEADRDVWRQLIDASPAGVVVSDADGRITVSNEATCRLLGSEVTGDAAGPRGGYELLRSDGSPLPEDELPLVRAIKNGETTRDVDLRIRLQDGSERVVLASGKPLRAETGAIRGAVAVMQDITARTRMQEELLRHGEFERLTCEILSDIAGLNVNELDAGIDRALARMGEFTDSDRAYVFEFRDGGAMIDNTYEWCHEGVQPQIEGLKGISVRTELPWFAKCIMAHEIFYVPDVTDLPPAAQLEREHFESQGIRSLIAVPMLSRGELQGFLGFDSVRERRRWSEEEFVLLRLVSETIALALDRAADEAALRESREELDEIFTLSPHLVCITDINESKFLKVNPAFTRVLGYDEAEMVNHPFSEFIHPDDAEPTRKVVEDELQKGTRVTGFTNRCRRKDGMWSWLEWAAHPLPERGIAFCFATDVTERRRMQERLRQTEKMEAIGQLAGGVAHDFNNQLTGIMNCADLLLSKTQDEDLKPFIKLIIQLCTHSGNLTNQLLAFARKGQYESAPVDMHEVVREVVSILRRGSDRRIAFRQLFEATPSTTTGDASQLQNVVLNLGLNARDAMPDGGELLLRTDTVTLDEKHCAESTFALLPGQYLRIRVTDTGIGMDKETCARAFEPFFTTKPQGKGTGMGLASAYGTVTNHQGAIEIESEEGKGTTVTMLLPLSRDVTQQNAGGVVPGASESGTGRILFVDDEKSIRETTAALLRKRGYRVVTCENGAEAVEYYRKSWKHIDLVVLDMNMPVMNGRDAFRAMREINPNVKAALATGFSLDSPAQEMLDEGALFHAQKPFRVSELAAQMELVLTPAPAP